ncbi:MAG: endonuclease [Bacteroidia bacterium]|nr:endonuclease [Bacteroidia bacterium]
MLTVRAQEKVSYQVAVVGFYNLENLFDTLDDPKILDEEFLPGGSKQYSGTVYKDKLSHLSDVISLIGTEMSPEGLTLMGCAEVENENVLKDLVRTPKLQSRNYHIVHYDSPDARGIDVGLLYNPKYFRPLFSEPLTVHLFNPDSSEYHTRDVLYVYGELSGEPIHILVGHWPSRRGGEEVSAPSRAKAAAVCRHKIDSITTMNPDAKIILMGDLNDDPTSPSVSVVIGAKGEKDQVKRGGMYNPWVNMYKEGIGTLAYNDSWNLFDQIMVSSGWLDKKQQGFFFQDAKIFSRPWMTQTSGRYKGYPKRTYDFDNYAGGYSDHFPTYIELLRKIK